MPSDEDIEGADHVDVRKCELQRDGPLRSERLASVFRAKEGRKRTRPSESMLLMMAAVTATMEVRAAVRRLMPQSLVMICRHEGESSSPTREPADSRVRF